MSQKTHCKPCFLSQISLTIKSLLQCHCFVNWCQRSGNGRRILECMIIEAYKLPFRLVWLKKQRTQRRSYLMNCCVNSTGDFHRIRLIFWNTLMLSCCQKRSRMWMHMRLGGSGTMSSHLSTSISSKKLPGCLDTERAKVDYPCYKAYLRRTMVQLATTGRVFSFSAFAKDTTTLYAEEFPDFCTLLEFLMDIPMNSATCERGFSAQNRIKTAKRNRLNDDRLETILKVSINGPRWGEFDYTNAAENFRELKRRCIV